MSRSPQTSPTNTQLPQFEGWEVIEKLGAGGMCEVYRARPLEGGPERAIKLLTDRSDISIRRFVDEATLLQRIDHPNVVRVHSISPDERPPWLVMDLLGGRDLDETMNIEGPMDPERAARLFADLADGLAAVHAAGVRHRDIKPANIRLGTDGTARLIDFGIAREADSARYTKQGFVVGTASYLPPEIFVEDDAHAIQDTETADVYALGQTLCEALAGRPVHQIKPGTEASLLVRIMRDKVDRPHLDPRDFGGRLPEDLAKIVTHATAREPAQRIQTARQLATDLRSWLVGRTSASAAPISRVDLGRVSLPPKQPSLPPAPKPTPPPAPPRPRRGLWVAAYGFVGALGMAGTAAVLSALLALALVGMALLWIFRPAHDTTSSQILATVEALEPSLAKCGRGRVTYSLTVERGTATQIRPVTSTLDKRSDRCVRQILEAARYPPTERLTLEIPLLLN